LENNEEAGEHSTPQHVVTGQQRDTESELEDETAGSDESL
jgi:hypothetical protein